MKRLLGVIALALVVVAMAAAAASAAQFGHPTPPSRISSAL